MPRYSGVNQCVCNPYKPGVIDQQLLDGRVEVNVGALDREEIIELVGKLAAATSRIKALRLVCMPKGIGWLQYQYDAQQDRRARKRFVFHTEAHHKAVDQASEHMQHKRVRVPLHKVLLNIFLQSEIEELQIGVRLSPGCYKALASGLARNTTLRRLSFAGSHMGDEALQLLQDSLSMNSSLEELDLTACGLTDQGAATVGTVVKRHADRRVGQAFDRQLREYPDTSRDTSAARMQHQRTLRAAAHELDVRCGGLLHIELAENRVTDKGAQRLCMVLSYDRRLVLLSLRANALTSVSEREFVELMRDHRALLRVDLRQNPDPVLCILKLRRPRVPPAFNPALGFSQHSQHPAQPPSPTRTEHSAALWELLDSASLAGQSPGGGYLGHGPDSPRTAHPTSRGQEAPGSPSVISWGEEQLLSGQLRLPQQTSSPRAAHSSPWLLQPQALPPPHKPALRPPTRGAQLVTQSWSPGDKPRAHADGNHVHGQTLEAAPGLPLDLTQRYSQPSDGPETLAHQSSGRPGAANILADLAASHLVPGIFVEPGDRFRAHKRRKQLLRSRTRAGQSQQQHRAYSSQRLHTRRGTIAGLHLSLKQGPGAHLVEHIYHRPHAHTTHTLGATGAHTANGPRSVRRNVGGAGLRHGYQTLAGRSTGVRAMFSGHSPVPRQHRKPAGTAATAADRAATAQAKAAAHSRALAQAAAAASAELVQRDLQAVEELGQLFQDLELAVASLELLQELHRNEPEQYRQYLQQQQAAQKLNQVQYACHPQPTHDRAALEEYNGVDQKKVGGIPIGHHNGQGGEAACQPEALGTLDMAQRLQRWRDMCDLALSQADA